MPLPIFQRVLAGFFAQPFLELPARLPLNELFKGFPHGLAAGELPCDDKLHLFPVFLFLLLIFLVFYHRQISSINEFEPDSACGNEVRQRTPKNLQANIRLPVFPFLIFFDFFVAFVVIDKNK